jgi:hypothetical protein
MGGARRGRRRTYVPSPTPLLVVDFERRKESVGLDEQTTRINRVGVAVGLKLKELLKILVRKFTAAASSTLRHMAAHSIASTASVAIVPVPQR